MAAQDARDGRPQPPLLHGSGPDGRRRHARFVSRERLADEGLLDLVSQIKIHRDNALTARYPRGIPNRSPSP